MDIQIDESGFDPDTYMRHLIKTKKLPELIDRESELCKEIKNIGSDMQTLVYENYNKFITATDTIQQMKTEIDKMSDEVIKLRSTMDDVSEYNTKISSSLKNRRDEMSRVVDKHNLLKKLKFFSHLPNQLQEFIDEKNYEMAINCYETANKNIEQATSKKSFKTIRGKCDEKMERIKNNLFEQFDNLQTSGKELSEVVGLLQKLKVEDKIIVLKFLEFLDKKCEENLNLIKSRIRKSNEVVDVGRDEVMVPRVEHSSHVNEQQKQLKSGKKRFERICQNSKRKSKKTNILPSLSDSSSKSTTEDEEEILNKKNPFYDENELKRRKEEKKRIRRERKQSNEKKLKMREVLIDSDEEDEMDETSFIEYSCNLFVYDFTLFISVYRDRFVKHEDDWKENEELLKEKILFHFSQFFDIILSNMKNEIFNNHRTIDIDERIRGIDRLYRRLIAADKIIRSKEIIDRCICCCLIGYTNLVDMFGKYLERSFINLILVLHEKSLLINEKNEKNIKWMEIIESELNKFLGEVENVLRLMCLNEMILLEQVPILTNLILEIIIEQRLFDVLHQFILDFIKKYLFGDKSPSNSFLLLATSKLCEMIGKYYICPIYHIYSELHDEYVKEEIGSNKTESMKCIQYLLSLRKDSVSRYKNNEFIDDELMKFEKLSKFIVNQYIRLTGYQLGTMIEKSTEARDWRHAHEPRQVRSVIRRLTDELVLMESDVAQFFPPKIQHDKGISSESSSHNQLYMKNFSSEKIKSPSSNRTSSKYENVNYYRQNLHVTAIPTTLPSARLFSEQIKIFDNEIGEKGKCVKREDITNGVIKIMLKTFIEAVRLCTFNQFGLQQMQVDANYLLTNLWTYVLDETMLQVLIDQLINSTVVRCQERNPKLMDPTIVESLCE
ncbi:hypothetical protein SNEBB_003308 [Seison nebaliae]|nr:hypothetical protein SNEBB_003308 [Seison nebaliae]